MVGTYRVVAGIRNHIIKLTFGSFDDAMDFAHAVEKSTDFWSVEVLEFIEKAGYVKPIYDNRGPDMCNLPKLQ